MDDLTQLHAMFDKLNKRIIDARLHVIGLIDAETREADSDPTKAAIHRAKADAYREVYDYVFMQKSIF